MQRELTEIPQKPQTTDKNTSPNLQTQHGLLLPEHGALNGSRLEPGLDASVSLPSINEDASAARPTFDDALNADQLDEKLRRLKLEERGQTRAAVPGQRVIDYENALILTPGKSPQHAVGFRVAKNAGASNAGGVQLTDFPNEILTHVLSHLHPDSHAAVALVSKRFYALVTTPYAWRTAFLRYFPGQDAISRPTTKAILPGGHDAVDRVKSESRRFARLTLMASWRSEYLLRTRLLRNLARGKPGTGSAGSGLSSRSIQTGKRSSAVLTYNSKLPWVITSIHASFVAGKKGPRVIHGASDLGLATISDPTLGKVEKWGVDDPFSAAQLDEMFPNLEFYGLGDGPAAMPNVIDVSQPFGIISGEGFPGGRVYFRGTDELRGRYLGPETAIIDMSPEIPKIPELSEAMCSVWIAKSSAVPSMTQSMIGIMTGSSLGVVTTYALGYDTSGPRYSNGDITARWVLSPGVPIVALKVDENYGLKRKSMKRVLAVALNALGEVFFLTEPPTPPANRSKAENALKDAWLAGRTVYWELIESSRRTARPDDFDKNAIRGAYSPRSSSHSMGLTKDQLVAEAQEMEKFLRHKPSHFRKVCEGWDMRRRLEVDFAGGEESGTGESIFVIACGHEKGERAGIVRYGRRFAVADSNETGIFTPVIPSALPRSTLFGGTVTPPNSAGGTPGPVRQMRPSISAKPGTPELGPSLPCEEIVEEWQMTKLVFKNSLTTEITTSALDLSTYALLAWFEDPLHPGSATGTTAADVSHTPTSKNSTGEIPGRRSRFLAVGTNTGSVIAWDAREDPSAEAINPVRIVQTESPSISCIAVSALYMVHGGSDGLVQAWDSLASSPEPIRTLNAKSSGRIPRQILNANPALQQSSYTAVGAIFLDPDPAVLRGILTCGLFVRFWSYSSTSQAPGRKRRIRHADIHGRLASRRQFSTVSSYIAAEAAELRHEQQERSREQNRLRNRFGVGLGDLTEEEAIRYAQMISEESFQADEQRRNTSASDTGDTGSAADLGDVMSYSGSGSGGSSVSGETITPEPSVSGVSASASVTHHLPPLQEETDDDYEAQIQRAIRLSLMEGVNDQGQSPRGNGSGEYDFQVKVKVQDGKKGKRKNKGKRSPDSSSSSQVHTPVVQYGESSRGLSATPRVDPDEELELALQLSMVEEQDRQRRVAEEEAAGGVGLGIQGQGEEYPPLGMTGKGKGRSM